ncbi:MAG: hypothetical protein LBP87_13325 [Planctomycetaceae bacterium]|jgi:hypothetical protein|nr:hypothetical protein [Planctomycetaceae bacterium]
MINNRIITLFFCLICNVSVIFADIPAAPSLVPENISISKEIPEEGIYLTKSEFETFLQQYHSEHSQKQGWSPKNPALKNLAWKKGNFTITPYGFIYLSTSYETQRTIDGDCSLYANSPDFERDASFNIDPKSSRLGVKLEGPGIPIWNGSKSEGAIEFDFQGAFNSRNRGSLLFRKAYVAISDGYTKFFVGQDWEIVSPLAPNILNDAMGWDAGNLGCRRAMLRIDHKFDFCNSSHLLAQFCIGDNVFRGGALASPAATSWPVFQGRLAYTFGEGYFQHGKPITLGLSSHIGAQRFTFAENDRKELKTWSFNVDVDLPITKKLGFQMEYFLGENLATIEGGIGQGVDFQRRNTIRSQGGWVGFLYQCTKKLQMNFCYLLDDPFNKDVVSGCDGNNLSRTYNQVFFLNAMYNWNDALMTGFEVDFWRTHWQRYNPLNNTVTALTPGTPIRYELLIRYSF